jgi:Methylamine utilisation protein MauE
MRRVLLICGRLALAAVFLWAAYTKLRDPWMIFAMEIDAMQIAPAGMLEPVARTLPWFELLIGILLVIGIQLRYVATVATVFLLGFFTTLLVLYLRGFQGDCGCFGPGERLGPKTLARDALLVALSIWVTREAFRRARIMSAVSS